MTATITPTSASTPWLVLTRSDGAVRGAIYPDEETARISERLLGELVLPLGLQSPKVWVRAYPLDLAELRDWREVEHVLLIAVEKRAMAYPDERRTMLAWFDDGSDHTRYLRLEEGCLRVVGPEESENLFKKYQSEVKF